MFIFHSKYIVYSKRCRENLQFLGQLCLLRPPKIAQSRDLVSRFVCAIRLESRILMFLVRLPFTCLVQSSTTVNTTCEIFFQYKVLWLIKPLEQCQLLQSATGVICKELQALKVKAIQCDRYRKVLINKVLDNKELRLNLRQRRKTYLLLLGVQYCIVYIFISQSKITCHEGRIEDTWRVYIRNSTFYLQKFKQCRLV